MTLSDQIRAHALSTMGGRTLWYIRDDEVFHALFSQLVKMGKGFYYLTPIERRLFCLFVAEALEES